MCGRYTLYSTKILEEKFNHYFFKNYNISPGAQVFLLDENFKIIKRKWGIKPFWNNNIQLINARYESYSYKNTFRELKRCAFFTDGFYEWKKDGKNKIPFYHFIKEGFFFFAGLYNEIECCILTQNNKIKNYNIHDRQPVCINNNFVKQWLQNSKVVEFSNYFYFHQVTSLVNYPKNNNENLIKNFEKYS